MQIDIHDGIINVKSYLERNSSMTKNIFQYIPEDFFKPLSSKYKKEYAECIQLIYDTFRTEISYGINREIVISVLEGYFNDEKHEMYFDDSQEIIKSPREQANVIVRNLKACGWIEYENVENHEINLILNEYAIPIIETFHKIIREEETEYLGIISQIYSTVLNKDLYHKPYELILKGVKQNTDRLLSELKKLSASIKRHMEKQTNKMEADEVLEHLFLYQQDIGSKAYMRMKTNDNINFFRSDIIDQLNEMLATESILERATVGCMELEGLASKEEALDAVVEIINSIKSSFNRVDDIIEEIDKKHAKYIRVAVMRAKFLLSTGNNMEGKLLQILNLCVEQMNQKNSGSIYEETENSLLALIHIYPQKYLESESLRAIPITKKIGVIDQVSSEDLMSTEERLLYKEALQRQNRNRFTRKNINQYVDTVLENQDRIKASSLEVHNRRDLIRLIYISVYGNNKSNCYHIERSRERIQIQGYEIPDFEIIRSK